jgi:HTH-type transcriptional regulator/antitoxin HigA
MNTQSIESEDQYLLLMQEIEALAMGDPSLDSPAGERLELLASLVEDYEKARFEFARPDPIEAIRFRTEQQNSR